MGKIIVTEFISMDGVMQAPGGAEDFKYSGWTFDFDRGKDGDKFKLDETLGSEALLLGHRTYVGFAAAWPTITGEFADKFNSMPKYVVSSTLKDPTWHNTKVLSGEPMAAVAELKQKLKGNIVVHGSAMLVQTLIEHDLVDEMHLMVFPVVLGLGKKLFGETTDKKTFKLAESKTVGEGIVILIYKFPA